MASGSLKKKHNKRPILKPHTPNPMASRFKPSSNCTKTTLIVSAFLFLFVFWFSAISFKTRSKFNPQSHDDSFPKIYTIEVLNEFPHDPDAFTQVTFLSYQLRNLLTKCLPFRCCDLQSLIVTYRRLIWNISKCIFPFTYKMTIFYLGIYHL